MRAFIKKHYDNNKPIFVMGLVIFTIFLVIITLAWNKKPTGLYLREITEETNGKLNNNWELEETEATKESTETVAKDPLQIFDEKYGVVEIKYTTDGFTPMNVRAYQGQLVRWTNQTYQDIAIKQINNVYPEFKTAQIIPANGTFEFRFTKNDLWSYQEVTTKSFGSILFITPAKTKTK